MFHGLAFYTVFRMTFNIRPYCIFKKFLHVHLDQWNDNDAAERNRDYWGHTFCSAADYLPGKFSGTICLQQLRTGPTELHSPLQQFAIFQQFLHLCAVLPTGHYLIMTDRDLCD